MAIPMLVPFVLAFPGCQPLLDGLMANYSYWSFTEEAANKDSVPAGETTGSGFAVKAMVCVLALEDSAVNILKLL